MNAVSQPPYLYKENRFTTTDGLSLYFRDYGDQATSRTAIICIPGFNRNCRDYHRIATHFVSAHGRRVICLDLRGRGQSDYDPNPFNYVWPTYVRDTFALIDHLGIPQIIALGTSNGGATSILMAAARPSAIKGIVLNDVGCHTETGFLPGAAAVMRNLPTFPALDIAAGIMKSTMAANYVGLSDDSWDAFASRLFKQGPDGIYRFDFDPHIGDVLQLSLTSPEEQLEKCGVPPVYDLWDEWRSITAIPALLLRGVFSTVITPETVARMRAEHPLFRAVDIPGRGHAPLLDEPLSLDAIDSFLETLP